MGALAPLILTQAVVLSLPRIAAAQMFHTIDGGLSLGSARVASMGFTVQGSLGHQYAPGAAWRVDAFVTQFQFQSPTGGPIACGPGRLGPTSVCGGTPGPATKGSVGVGASELLYVTAPSSDVRVYVIAGAEFDYLYLYTTVGRAGGSAGLGIQFPTHDSKPTWDVEVRYHRLATRDAPTWFLPLTIGLRF